MNWSLPGATVHGILQAIILEWFAIYSFTLLLLNSLVPMPCTSLPFSYSPLQLEHWGLKPPSTPQTHLKFPHFSEDFSGYSTAVSSWSKLRTLKAFATFGSKIYAVLSLVFYRAIWRCYLAFHVYSHCNPLPHKHQTSFLNQYCVSCIGDIECILSHLILSTFWSGCNYHILGIK